MGREIPGFFKIVKYPSCLVSLLYTDIGSLLGRKRRRLPGLLAGWMQNIFGQLQIMIFCIYTAPGYLIRILVGVPVFIYFRWEEQVGLIFI